jgi:hypothetical protein
MNHRLAGIQNNLGDDTSGRPRVFSLNGCFIAYELSGHFSRKCTVLIPYQGRVRACRLLFGWNHFVLCRLYRHWQQAL